MKKLIEKRKTEKGELTFYNTSKYIYTKDIMYMPRKIMIVFGRYRIPIGIEKGIHRAEIIYR